MATGNYPVQPITMESKEKTIVTSFLSAKAINAREHKSLLDLARKPVKDKYLCFKIDGH